MIVSDVLLLLAAASVPAAAFAPLSGLAFSRRAPTLFAAAPPAARRVDAVRYDPSRPETNCDDEYDTVVIGSGIGGLVAASCLAQSREQHKVLVLEQHHTCGGGCHTFESGGYRFAPGIHYVGEVGDVGGVRDGTRLNLKKVINAATSEADPIEWSYFGKPFEKAVFGYGPSAKYYDIVGGGEEEQKERLKAQFPPETHEAIDEYYVLLNKASYALVKRGLPFKMLPLRLAKVLMRTRLYRLFDKGLHKYLTTSLREVVNSLTDNEELRAVMCYMWGDLAASPDELPFGVYALAATHFFNGAYYPRHGPQSIPQKIIPVITSLGGQVLASAPVESISVDETGRASGVVLADGRKIRARKAVVSDAGIINTFHRLLPSTLKAKDDLIKNTFRRDNRYKQLPHDKLHGSKTGIGIFVGLDGDHDLQWHLPKHQFWRHSSADPSTVDGNFRRLEQLSLREALESLKPSDLSPVFVGTPSGKDESWKSEYPDKAVLEVFTFVPWKWFEEWAPDSGTTETGLGDLGGKPHSHGAAYEEAKAKLADLLWTNAVDLLSSDGVKGLPNSLKETSHYVLASPLTFAHYLRGDEGAWYGLEQDMVRFHPRTFIERLRPEVPEVPGLYLSGQDMFTDSFISSAGAGMACASKILGPLNPYSVLRDRKTDRDPSKEWDCNTGFGFALGL